MNNQEAKKILQRDLAILIENKSLPDGIEAMKVAISALGAIEQFRFERDITIEQLRELGLELDIKTDEVQQAINFKKYFDELYGEGLEVANWHLNGDLEPFDNFYENALQNGN